MVGDAKIGDSSTISSTVGDAKIGDSGWISDSTAWFVENWLTCAWLASNSAFTSSSMVWYWIKKSLSFVTSVSLSCNCSVSCATWVSDSKRDWFSCWTWVSFSCNCTLICSSWAWYWFSDVSIACWSWFWYFCSDSWIVCWVRIRYNLSCSSRCWRLFSSILFFWLDICLSNHQ